MTLHCPQMFKNSSCLYGEIFCIWIFFFTAVDSCFNINLTFQLTLTLCLYVYQ